MTLAEWTETLCKIGEDMEADLRMLNTEMRLLRDAMRQSLGVTPITDAAQTRMELRQ